ncbi:MAG: hypothetical protein E7299_07175 [Lachnospiraceae bacterium]|nr:hypothetical protein [Lachnospiraceae bacterium]
MKKSVRKTKLFKSLFALSLAVTMFVTSALPAQANVLGIDVSKWNGGINWGAVAASGVSYTFVKVGSTKSGIDPRFHENIINAQAAGIRTGVYIYSYARNVPEAINEANLVLQWIANYNINFPVAFDIEDSTQQGLDANTVTAMCNAFCDVIAGAGYHPIVYTGANFYQRHMTPALRYDKWIAHYSSSCKIPGYSIWQASQTGRIAGVPSNVDINYMVKDYRSYILPVGFAQRPDGTYFYNNYRIQFGWVDFNGLRYHMDATGRMNTGWYTDETGTYYLNPVGGHALVGQNIIDKAGYMFDERGAMLSGWQTVGPFKFYYNPLDGNRMLTGWFDDLNGRYYFSPLDGHMMTGYTPIGKENYYFNEEGLMQRGIINIAGANFYFDPISGAQQTGFISDGVNRYYFTPMGGQMLTGLQPIDGKVYYFNEKGHMQVGLQTIGGLTYYFDPMTGQMLTGLQMTPQGVWYFSTLDGHMAKNEIAMVDNVPRCFDANGNMVVNNVYTIGGVTYACNETGAIIFPVIGQTGATAAAQ